MDHKKRSPKDSQQNGFIKDPKSDLYIPTNLLRARDKKTSWLLQPRRGGKTLWDWLELLIVPGLIATIAGVFTLITVSQQNEISQQQNEIFKQRDESENNRNQKALLNEYVTAISRLVEQNLLTLEESSKTHRVIARARTFSILRALDSDRKGELLQFLSTAKLVEADNYNSIISLVGADLKGTNFGKNDFKEARNLTPTQVKSACNWEEAEYSEKFKEELAQEPNQEIDCSYWDKFLGIK